MENSPQRATGDLRTWALPLSPVVTVLSRPQPRALPVRAAAWSPHLRVITVYVVEHVGEDVG